MEESVIFDEELPKKENLNAQNKNYEKVNKKILMFEKKYNSFSKEITNKLDAMSVKDNQIILLEEKHDDICENILEIDNMIDINKTNISDLKIGVALQLSKSKNEINNNIIQIKDDFDELKKVSLKNEEMKYCLYTNMFLTICIIGFNYFRR